MAAALLTWAGLALAQQPAGGNNPAGAKEDQPAAKEPTLEEMLAQALKDNPDIRVAEAKRQEADALLNKARLQVMQQVVALNAARKEAQAGVAQAERDLARLHRLGTGNLVSAEEVQKAETALLTAKAALEKAEADLALVLGKHTIRGVRGAAWSPDGKWLATEDVEGRVRIWDAATGKELAAPKPPVTGTVAERFRKALETPVKIDYKGMLFDDVLRDLERQVPGVKFNNQLGNYKGGNPAITLQFKEPLPLRGALEALEDDFQDFQLGSLGRIVFVVREYGILVTPSQFVPPGAVQVDEFKPGEQPKASGPAGDKNPPPGPVEGTIKEVENGGDLVRTSVGSDAGLAKGNTLEVYRLNPAKYLGTLRLIEVRPQEAVGKMEGRHADVQVGDLVSSKLVGQ